jgi:hypothetical protein
MAAALVTEAKESNRARRARTKVAMMVSAGAFHGKRPGVLGWDRTIQIDEGKEKALTHNAIIQAFSLFPWVDRATPAPMTDGAMASGVRTTSARITRADRATRHRMRTDARGSAMMR